MYSLTAFHSLTVKPTHLVMRISRVEKCGANNVALALEWDQEEKMKKNADFTKLVCRSLQAQALALKETIISAKERWISRCDFCTNSATLVKIAAQLNPLMSEDWVVFSEVYELWKQFKENPQFVCPKMSRNQICSTDYLAKMTIIEEWNYICYTFSIFRMQLTVFYFYFLLILSIYHTIM